jgi:hypothetical protein
MEAPEVRYKMVDTIRGMENYPDYAIDVMGNVWSFKFNKFRKLKPSWAKKKDSYLIVRLADVKCKMKSFYIHRLVAMAYLPSDDYSNQIRHMNKDLNDNRIENLEWKYKKKKIRRADTGRVETIEVRDMLIDDFIIDKLKQAHIASHHKGLPVPDSYAFTNTMIDGALEDYINRYGLRKIMHQLGNQ